MLGFLYYVVEKIDVIKIKLTTVVSKQFKMEQEGSDEGQSVFDIATFNLDSPPSRLKSDEQIKRHSIDSNLESKPVEKALYLFTSGEEVQKLSVIYSVPDLFKEDPTGCLQRLIPKMQQSLPNASTEFHIATSQTVKTIMEKKIIPTDMFVQTFLHTILMGLEHRDAMVADAWLNCLLEVIPFLPYPILVREIQPIAVQRSALQKPVVIRVSSCRIIGALCKKYSAAELKRELLPVILSLCQDVNSEVRATICPQLSLAIRPIGHEAARTMLLPVIVDLASDESPKVKEIAYTTIVDSVPYFSIETIKNVILPLLKQLCNYAFKFDENVLVAVAASYGKMVIGLERVIAQSDKEGYLKSYIALAEKGILPRRKPIPGRASPRMRNEDLVRPSMDAEGKNESMVLNKYKLLCFLDYGIAYMQVKINFSTEKLVQCRQYCAYNYPALAKFVYSDNNRYLLDMLHRVFANFVIDPYYIIRRTVASAFHEIVKIYGKYGALLKPEIIILLKDEAEEVIEGFVPNLGYSLVTLVRVGAFASEQMETTLSDIVRSLVKCESLLASSHNWRLYCNFIQQLEVLWFLFPSEIVFNHFIILLFKRIFGCRILPVRLACVRTILVNLRYIQKPVHRNEIRNRIISELASSSSFYDRMLYIQSCDAILDIFSATYFKEHFFIKTIQLAGDQVPNIRWGVSKLLPKLHAFIKLPAEKRLLVMLDAAMQQLSADKDQETLAMVMKVKASIERQQSYDNLFDQRKYEEEKKLLNLNQKISLNFPASVTKLFVPTINGVPLDEISVSAQPSTTSDARASVSKYTRGPRSSSMSNSNPGQVTFTDQDFLVDTGIKMPLSKLGKNDFQKGNSHKDMAVPIVSPSAIDETTKENTDNLNSNHTHEQNDTVSMKKKPGFRYSIPVRKKTVSTTDESSNRKISGVLEKRHSLEVMDANKNINLNQGNEEGTSSTVQRRKKSQLPRPLSCVVLPVRNGTLEKAIPPSRLPVMRR